MTPAQKERIRELFLAACEQDPAQRAEFLRRACADDELVHREVESLLANDDEADSFLKTPALGRSFADAHPESLLTQASQPTAGTRAGGLGADGSVTDQYPERIGQYKILGVLGRGGMGVVFEAEQENPRRTIALKVIRPGIASEQVLRRFKFEAHVLGRLHHPGIAQVYEAGTAEFETASGLSVEQPFFAMEYIRGEPLTTLIARQELVLRQRLELFADICDAVHHAHQKGVIHRDLKPGNILVDDQGQPKILDFGVARVTDADIRATTMQTSAGQLVGTMAYMSPEQVAGDSRELDTRSDVYALGVILYELLAGRTPVDVSEKTIPQALRAITEEEPSSLSSINRVFRGDVETIVAKALEKDKERRYQSASALASDIRRHLANQPITARPPSTFYQVGKFAKRNKPVVAAVAIAFVLLSGGLIQVTVDRNRAVAAERIAGQQAAIAQAVNDFLNDDLLAAVSPEKLGRDVTMRQVLDHAAEAVEGRFEDEPLVAAAIHATLGETYHALGDYAAATPHFEQALELRRMELGEDHRATLTSMCDLATMYKVQGRYDEAEPLYVDSLEGRRRGLGDDHPSALIGMFNLATLYYDQADFDQAEPLLLESLAGCQRVFGEDHPQTLLPLNNLATLYAREGRLEEAEPLMVKALSARRRLLGEEHLRTLVSMNNLANVYCEQGRYDQAEPLYAKTLEVRRRVLGEEHPRTLSSVGNLGYVYSMQGRHDEAEPLYVHAAQELRRILGEDHPQTLLRLNNLAVLYYDRGRYGEAVQLQLTTLSARRRVLGEDHTHTLSTLHGLVRSLIALGKLEEAEPLAIECHERHSAVHGPEHDKTRQATELLVELYNAWGKPDHAAEWRAKLPATEATAEPPSP